MIFLKLFFEFFKTGLFAIGGGLATLPFLQDMAVKTGWFTNSMLTDMIAVSESTPGPIGVNMATYAGYQTAGILGALSATLGIVAPAFLIVILVARVLNTFKDNRYVKGVFYGLRPAVVGLIGAAGITVAKSSLLHLPINGGFWNSLDVYAICIFLLVFILFRRFKKHPIWYLLGSAFLGILLGFL